VDLRFDELVRTAEELGGDDDDGSGTVADLLVLLLREVDEDPAGRVLDCEKREDGGTVIGDGDFLVNE
jgi:hypothetical protein